MPPEIPRVYNPVGIYERSPFAEKKTERGCTFVLKALNPAARVYVNGSFVGYSEGSLLLREYDITDYAVDGENQLVGEGAALV